MSHTDIFFHLSAHVYNFFSFIPLFLHRLSTASSFLRLPSLSFAYFSPVFFFPRRLVTFTPQFLPIQCDFYSCFSVSLPSFHCDLIVCFSLSLSASLSLSLFLALFWPFLSSLPDYQPFLSPSPVLSPRSTYHISPCCLRLLPGSSLFHLCCKARMK